MSLTNPDKLVTEQDLSDFYQGIFPYLGGTKRNILTPVGTVIAVMGNHAPDNYLKCEGQVVNIADYPQLAYYFEQEFGSKNNFGGNGTTTFGIPDLRGEFLRGTGTNSHTDQGDGANVGVHQDGTKQSYCAADDGNNLYFSTNDSVEAVNKNLDNGLGSGKLAYLHSSSVSTTSTFPQAYTSRPTNTSVLWCIASKNIMVDIGTINGGSFRFSKSDMYDKNERVIGKWIDGKPLYQKTWDLGSNVTISNTGTTELTAIDGTGIERMIGCFAVTSSVDYSIPLMVVHESNDSSVSAIALRSNNTVAVRYVTIQYTKTTDSANSFKYGSDTDYSTEEKIVGTWIDGKPLYQKTITVASATIGSYSDFNVDTTSLLDNANISVKDFRGGYYADKGGASQQFYPWGNIVRAGNADYGYNACYRQANRVIRINGTWGNVQYTISDLIFTIQYTKTTD